KGEVELVAHQISEIVPVKGVALVGPLPKDLQKITTYSAGLAARSAVPEAARAFIAFLARPAFKSRFAAAPTALASRSPDLAGKTIGELWDYLFKGEEIFPLIRRALAQRYPGVRFVDYETLGSTHGRDEAELAATLPARLRKHGCDAVISAVGA